MKISASTTCWLKRAVVLPGGADVEVVVYGAVVVDADGVVSIVIVVVAGVVSVVVIAEVRAVVGGMVVVIAAVDDRGG